MTGFDTQMLFIPDCFWKTKVISRCFVMLTYLAKPALVQEIKMHNLHNVTVWENHVMYFFHKKYIQLTLVEFQETLWKHFKISVPRNIIAAEVRKTINRTTTLTNEYAIWLLKLDTYWKYCGKEEKLLLLLFSTIFCYLFLDLDVKTGTRISLRDKRLVEISEVEITSVDYILWVRKGINSARRFYRVPQYMFFMQIKHSRTPDKEILDFTLG